MSTKYRILGPATAESLEALVNGALFDGWSVQGSVSVANSAERMPYYFIQAMVKREPLPPGSIIPHWHGGYVVQAPALGVDAPLMGHMHAHGLDAD